MYARSGTTAKKDPFGAPRINAKNFFGLTTETLNCNYVTEDDLSVNKAIIIVQLF